MPQAQGHVAAAARLSLFWGLGKRTAEAGASLGGKIYLAILCGGDGEGGKHLLNQRGK